MLPAVEVVGLGPAGPDLTTPQAAAVLAAAPAVLLRTARHPAAAPWLAAGAIGLDHCYERADSFEAVYAAVVEEVVAAAARHGSVAYAVPGSPVVLERSVAALRADRRVSVRLVPGMSFVELAFDRLGVDPFAARVRLVDAEDFAVAAAGDAGPLLLGHCWSRRILSEVKLAPDEAPDEPVTILHHLGLPDEQVVVLPWPELDRSLEPDHLTCVYVPRLADPPAGAMARLHETVRVLRERCPWDREQTHESLVRHLIEECYEVAEAIEELGPSPEAVDVVDAGRGAHLEEELGDLLVQVLFHARLAAEAGMFDLADVAASVDEKLVRRHPHVFGPPAGAASVVTARDVEGRWEQIKKQEKGRTSLVEGIPASLPALALAAKLERKLASAGLGWDETGLSDADLAVVVHAAAGGSGAGRGIEARRAGASDERPIGADDAGSGQPASLGDLLLALARRAARNGDDPEEALRRSATALRRRIVAAERLAVEKGGDLGLLDPPARLAAWHDAAPRAVERR